MRSQVQSQRHNSAVTFHDHYNHKSFLKNNWYIYHYIFLPCFEILSTIIIIYMPFEGSTARRTLEFGKTHVVRPKGKHQATIVWLHGLGDNGLRYGCMIFSRVYFIYFYSIIFCTIKVERFLLVIFKTELLWGKCEQHFILFMTIKLVMFCFMVLTLRFLEVGGRNSNQTLVKK
jgi:hypothetical protein